MTYVDFDSLLQEDEQMGEASAPEGSGVEGTVGVDRLIGRVWSSLEALVRVRGR